jgi:hypothetical protein
MKEDKPTADTAGIRAQSDGKPAHDGCIDVELYLSPDTLRRFEALGPDWRARMAEILNKAEV